MTELAMRRAILLLSFVLTGAMPLGAQVLDKYVGECFGGKPQPCSTYLVYDAVMAKQVAGTMKNHEGTDAGGGVVMQNRSFYAGLEAGVMKNYGFRNALGGTLEYDIDDAMRGRVALKARARRWLSPLATVDVAVGLVGETVWSPLPDQSSCGTCTESGYGLTADATFGHRLLGVTIGADIVSAYNQKLTSVRVGGRAGGIFAVAATAIAAAWMGAAGGAL
jgi:hypothetical protein